MRTKPYRHDRVDAETTQRRPFRRHVAVASFQVGGLANDARVTWCDPRTVPVLNSVAIVCRL